MGFYAPFSLLFGLLIIPLIIIMYLLKQKRQEIKVSSVFLWNQLLHNLQANTPWQKLKKNLLLFLQLLLAATIIAAVARPFLSLHAQVAESIVVLLDSSASMQATDISPNRFAAAQKKILEMIRDLPPNGEMTLIDLSHEPRVVAAATNNKSVLRNALKKVRVKNGEANFDNGYSLAVSILRGKTNSQIVYVGDGGALSERKMKLDHRFFSILTAKNGDNLAVYNISHRRVDGKDIALVQIINNGSNPKQGNLELYIDGRLFDVKEYNLKPGERKDLYWDNIPSKATFLYARITGQDSLSIDNGAWDLLQGEGRQKVLLVTSGNIFLEKVLQLFPRLEIYKSNPQNAPLLAGYDLYIFDGYLPEKLPSAPRIIFNPPAGNSLLKIRGETKIGSIRKQEEHPLMKYILTEDFSIYKAKNVIVPEWGTVVLDDGKHPLLIVGEKENYTTIVYTFDLHLSNLPLSIAFPILMQNNIDFLLPSSGKRLGSYYPYQIVNILPYPNDQSVKVITPNKHEMKIAPPFPVKPFLAPEELGIYEVEHEANGEIYKQYFAVNFPVKRESNIGIHIKTRDNKKLVGKVTNSVSLNREIWPWFAWVALFILIMEWWVYNRGY